jgi:hypothetical protein
MKCRFCNHSIKSVFVDLINSPASNSYLTSAQLDEPEIFYPLKVMVCDKCFLVQIDEYKKSSEIFKSDYAYFSSYSSSWLAHCESYVQMMIKRFAFSSSSLVTEIASNDGYLLQFFKNANIPVLGIEPTSNTASVALKKNIPTCIDFFSKKLAMDFSSEGKKADLIIGNNVLAHVPNIMDFVEGMSLFLSDDGIITMEFPHLYQLVLNKQFDTIYHEHFSYLTLNIVIKIFETKSLEIFDVQELSTHGGSLRVFAKQKNNNKLKIEDSVEILRKKEIGAGMETLAYYNNFQTKVISIKNELWNFLITQKKAQKKVIAYGAAAKGNTLLNYCGIKRDMIDFVVDSNPHKQNMFMPGSHIPIVDEKRIKSEKPDFILILPWNIKAEIMSQLSYTRDWNCKFVIPIPSLEIL